MVKGKKCLRKSKEEEKKIEEEKEIEEKEIEEKEEIEKKELFLNLLSNNPQYCFIFVSTSKFLSFSLTHPSRLSDE